jgi:TolB protein
VILVGLLLVAPGVGIGGRLLDLIDKPGTGPEMWGVTWSPDGRRIAFQRGVPGGKVELHVVNADGSGDRMLGRAKTWCASAWSPDGSRLAVASGSDGRSELLLVNADGGATLTVKRVPAQPSYWCAVDDPAWSSDGRKLVFAAGFGQGSEVYVVNADGSGLRRLTRNRAPDFGPSWSPDGRRITFVTDRSGDLANYGSKPGNFETFIVNPDGSGQARLTRSNGVAWSPNGRRFAFARDGSVYVVNADGSGQRRLTRIPRRGAKKAYSHVGPWSPDGRYVAFWSGNLVPRRGGVFSDSYVVRADGSGRWRLPWGGPIWAPDGRTMLLVRQRGNPSEIFAVDPDGSGLRNLSRNLTLDGSPAWSPDGRQIAFVSRRDGRYGIYLMNPDGSGQRRLTRSEG